MTRFVKVSDDINDDKHLSVYSNGSYERIDPFDYSLSGFKDKIALF